MRIHRENDQFWMNWGVEGNYFDLRNYKKDETFHGEVLHKFLFQDEPGREIQATFEAFKSVDREAPGIALVMRSLIRTDTSEAISVPELVFKSIHEKVLVKICSEDPEIQDCVPAW